jgi:hypothetical protein
MPLICGTPINPQNSSKCSRPSLLILVRGINFSASDDENDWSVGGVMQREKQRARARERERERKRERERERERERKRERERAAALLSNVWIRAPL